MGRERMQSPALEASVGEYRVALAGGEGGDRTHAGDPCDAGAKRTELADPLGGVRVGGAEDELRGGVVPKNGDCGVVLRGGAAAVREGVLDGCEGLAPHRCPVV